MPFFQLGHTHCEKLNSVWIVSFNATCIVALLDCSNYNVSPTNIQFTYSNTSYGHVFFIKRISLERKSSDLISIERFPSAWWVTSRTYATAVKWVRRRAAPWPRRTNATSRRCLQQRTTWISPTSSPNSSGMWWNILSIEVTADGTVAPSPWPSSSTMSLERGESLFECRT